MKKKTSCFFKNMKKKSLSNFTCKHLIRNISFNFLFKKVHVNYPIISGSQNSSYRFVHEKVEAPNILMDLFEKERPDVVIHLAAQAGVRNSIKYPRAYLESNVNGTFELLEAARAFPP